MNEEQKIAIIGASCYFPDAPDLETFYRNIIAGDIHTSDFPIEQRWGPDIYAPDAEQSLQGTYCNQGGVINYDINFDPMEFTMPPKELLELDPDQLMSINLTRSALADAGVEVDLKNLEAISCGVVLGKVAHVGTASARLLDVVRFLPQAKSLLREIMPNVDEQTLSLFEQRFLEQRSDFAVTRGISVMSNLLSSRVSERLNLNGPSYIVDGACASSLIAVQQAIRELRLGNAEMMAAGGLLFPVMSGFWKGFSYLGGLSRKGSISAFDQKADGILLGEGGGVVILKCLDKALDDGDRIYAVIESLECNNDGRGTGILAPSQVGQVQVIEHTWNKTNISPEQLSYIECHGTGMPLGDKTELNSMNQAFSDALMNDEITIGSVKSQIGHTLSAAGIASLIKSALCLYNRQIPPTSNCDEPTDELDGKPFKVSQQAVDIIGDHTLYSAVNAFGFGGVNSHAILSSYHSKAKQTQTASVQTISSSTISSIKDMVELQPDLILACHSKQALLAALEMPLASARAEHVEHAPHRIVIDQYDEASIKFAQKLINTNRRSSGIKGVFYSPEPIFINQPSSKISLVFPGISYFDPEFTGLVDRYELDIKDFISRSDSRDDSLESRGSSGMICSYVLSQVLKSERVNFDAVTGFSLGEFTAFIAAGVIEAKQLNQLLDAIEQRGDDAAIINDNYMMLSVNCDDKKRIEKIVSDIDNTYLSLINSSNNFILATHKDNKEAITARFKQEKLLFFDIGVNTVSHTILNKPVLDTLKPLIDEIELTEPSIDIWSSITGEKTAKSSLAIKELLYKNLFNQVDFERSISNMFDDGYRVFLQCGMGGASGYIKETLAEKDILTIDLVNNNLTLEQSMLNGLHQLWVEGYSLDSRTTKPQEQPKQSSVAVKLSEMVNEYFAMQPLVEHMNVTHTTTEGRVQSQPLSEMNGLSPSLQTLLNIGHESFQQAQTEVLDAYLANKPTAPISVETDFVDNHISTVAKQTVKKPKLIIENRVEAFNFERFPEFKDHEILKHPTNLKEEYRSAVVPLSGMIFRACEVVNELFPSKKISAVMQMTAKKFISLKEPVTIETTYTQTEENKVTVSWNEHFDCQIELCDVITPEKYEPEKWHIHQPRKTEQLIHYKDGMLFHGPQFQGLTHIVGNTIDQELVANVIYPGGYSAQLDSCFQISACWYDEFSGDSSSLILPLSIDRLSFSCDSRDFISGLIPQGYCTIFNTKMDEMLFSWDADYFHDQQLILKIRGFKDFKFESSKPLQGLYEAPQKLESSITTNLKNGLFVYESEVSTTWSWDLLRSAYLCNEERDRLETIKLYPDKTAYISGRVAAKDAFRIHHAIDLHMADVRINYNDAGMPFYDKKLQGKANPSLSLAHKKRIGVAVIGEHNERVGIDVEEIKQLAGLDTQLVFSKNEKTLIDQSENQPLLKTIMWTAKEAFIKSTAERYQQYATQLANIEISDLSESENDFNVADVETVFNGVINDTTTFTSIQWNSDYIITWIKELQ
jgi:acyl transferase domain-containing protein/phosphopantetheinyl transferase